jgi:outer membrane protein
MKKLLIPVFSLLALILSATAYAQDAKIGIIDVRQVLQKSPQVAAMQKRLQQEFGARDKQIRSAQEQLQKDVDKLNRDASVMNASDREALTKKAQSEQQDLRNMQMSFQKDVYAKQSQEMQSILGQMQTIVAKIAQQKNLNLVVTKDAVAYANNDLDITDDVMKEIQKK